jgi:F0F1-type ATP synthase assembly protein I
MDAPQKPDSGSTPSRLVRARQMGLSGLQASTMGLVMVGCITVGFLLGQWLDARFHTTYWMPILVVLGVVAGFREMFRTVVSINRHSQSLQEQSRRERAERTSNDFSGVQQSTADAAVETTSGTQQVGAEPEQTRSRVFKVPPPPQPSFARRATSGPGEADGTGANAGIDNQNAATADRNQAEDVPVTDAAEFARLTEDVDMLKRLLDDDQSDQEKASRENK